MKYYLAKGRHGNPKKLWNDLYGELRKRVFLSLNGFYMKLARQLDNPLYRQMGNPLNKPLHH